MGAVVVQASQINNYAVHTRVGTPTQLARFAVGTWGTSVATYFPCPTRIALGSSAQAPIEPLQARGSHIPRVWRWLHQATHPYRPHHPCFRNVIALPLRRIRGCRNARKASWNVNGDHLSNVEGCTQINYVITCDEHQFGQSRSVRHADCL